ncbi:TIGR03936 family radical SAM-associated protein [Nocardioides sp. URHA0020]|uniref:TIGR03936 family radical SAM-associated protein n=1 Tax=Nocardioides sp. URHA0020 TaxID=1380392 RepID=UPI00048E0532|nr:TIGR03936 family radical SAM-associated protein [Nocardioides sp. URHA0020]
MREQPEQQAPPVQRLRIRYAKRGRLRFTSHRDFSRAFERAIFRARLPMAYSSGFNPHPRISYAGASPTGAASEAEYLEIGLAQVVDPAVIRAQLEESLPDGLDVLEVVESAGGSLSDLLTGSHWLVDLATDPDAGVAAVAAFLAAETVTVERMTKKGLREFDCRAAVISMSAAAYGAGTRFDLVLRHAVPAVRPDDVLSGLGALTGLVSTGSPLLTRLAQGPLDEATGEIGDPLVVRG